MNEKLNTVVYSHYDSNCKIDDYVIYYLKMLKNSNCLYKFIIIFVSDNNLPSSELRKLDGIADYILAEYHGEYDFGSYKRGFIIALEKGLLEKTSNLIFVNDSCYGPFYPLDVFFDEMSYNDCDFYGFAANKNCYENKIYEVPAADNRHVQSYFIVFKRNVFTHKVFQDFIKSVKKEYDKKEIIIKYEIGLTSALCEAGFKYSAKLYGNIQDCNMNDLFNLKIKVPCMFFKKNIALWCYYPFILKFWLDKVKSCTDYPVELITSNLLRIRNKNLYKKKMLKKFLKIYLINTVKSVFLRISSFFD